MTRGPTCSVSLVAPALVTACAGRKTVREDVSAPAGNALSAPAPQAEEPAPSRELPADAPKPGDMSGSDGLGGDGVGVPACSQ